MSLGARIHEQAARTPDAIAVQLDSSRLTYAELVRRSDAVASALATCGIGSGDVVPICMDRCLGLLVGLVGILRAGAAYVPLDPEHPPARHDLVLEDTGARCVVAGAGYPSSLEQHGGHVVVVSDDGHVANDGDAQVALPTVGPDDLAYVIYTSGSTGRPKGVMNEHGPVLNRLDWMIEALAFRPADRILQKTTISFDVSVWELFAPLLCGARVVLARPGDHRDPVRLVETIRQQEVSVLHFVPSMLSAFLEEPSASTCHSIRAIVASGEALLPAHVRGVRERLGCPLWNLYGPTEAAVDVTYHLCDAEADSRSVPIGRPIRGAHLYVVDEQEQPCVDGEPGELWIGGVPVARGYLGREELTRERFTRDPFAKRPDARVYRTGDLVRRRSDGELEFLGRIDDQVKLRGVRIEPGEIEDALRACPGVAAAAVVLHQDAVRGAELVAYLAADRASAVPPDADLRAHLGLLLPSTYVPQHFVVLDALPLTSSGKLDRKVLASRRPQARATVAPRSEPGDEFETAVLSLWREMLGEASLGLDDDFLAWGGHSLLAVRLAARLESALGRRVPAASALLHRTPRALARALRQAPPRSPVSFEGRAPGEGQPLTSGQLALWLDHRIRPLDAAFHEALALGLHGPLDVSALRTSLRALASRHAALRTRFIERDGNPVQVVDEQALEQLEVRSMSSLQGEAWEALLRNEVRRPFDLASAPPWRALLLAHDGERHTLLLTFHHIAIDEWSLGLLQEDLGRLYQNALRGDDAGLPAAPAQMPDVAAWLLEHEATADETSALGGTQGLEAHLPRPPGPPPEPRSDRLTLDLPERLARSLGQRAPTLGATPFEAALAGFLVLIHQLTRRDQVAVGTPRTLRDGPALGGCVGYLLEMATASADLRTDPTYRELIAMVRTSVLRPAGRASLGTGQRPFEIVFVFLHDHASPPDFGDLHVSARSVWSGDAKYTLGFEVVLAGAQTKCAVEYRRDVLDERVAMQLPAAYAALMQALLDAPDEPLSAVSARLTPPREPSGAGTRPATLPPAVTLGTEDRAAAVQPSGELERTVLAVWREMLGVDGLGMEDDFVLAGGHSLLAVRIAARLQALLAREVPIGALLAGRTPRALARRLEASETAALSATDAPPRPAEVPLTRGQLALWLDHQLRPDDSAFHQTLGFRFTGDLDVPSLRNALSAVCARHESLRTRFLDRDGAVVQVVDSDPVVAWRQEASAGQGIEQLHDLLREEARRPFDLERSSPWRALLLVVGARDHILLLTFHHILVDEWSLEVLQQELAGAYAALSSGQAPDLGPPPGQMPDVANWLNTRESQSLASPRRHVDPKAIERYLPPPRQPNPSPSSGTLRELLQGDLPAALRDQASRLGATPFELALSAFAVLLHRLTRRSEVVIGAPRTLRAGPAHERCVGYLLDVAGIDVTFDDSVTLRGLIQQVRRALAAPASEAASKRGRRPYEIDFVYLQGATSPLEWGNLRVEPANVWAGDAKYALGFELALRADVLECTVEYRRDLLADAAAAKLPAGYASVLAWLLRHPDEAITQAPPLDADLQPTRVEGWSTGKRPLADDPSRLLDASSSAREDPLDATESQVATIWEQVLDTGPVGASSDFFLLGGSSLLAVRMVARVQQELGLTIPVRSLLTHPTLRDFVREGLSASRHAHAPAVVLLRDAPSGRPLLCVPGLGGHVFSYRHLLEHLPADRPLYGLQVQELDPESAALDSIESLAAELDRQARAALGERSFDLVGYSFGGVVVFEMARQREASGTSTGRLILIDAYMPGALQVRRGVSKLGAHLRELARRSPTGMWRYVAERVRRRLGLRAPVDATEETEQHGPAEARRLATEQRCHAAFRRYRGASSAQDIVLLRAARLSNWLVLDRRDPTCGWGAMTSGSVDTKTLDCEHLEVFHEPYIGVLGAMISSACSEEDSDLPNR